ncbi:MAG: hypothetical protein ACQESG_07185 [Nanobdellota archaeon]
MAFLDEPKGHVRHSTELGRVVELLTPAGVYEGSMPAPPDRRTLDILNHRQVIPDTPEPILEHFLELYDVHTPRGYQEVARVQKKNIVCAMDRYEHLGAAQERLDGMTEALDFYLTTDWRVRGTVMNFIPSYKNNQFIALSNAQFDDRSAAIPFIAVNTDHIMDYRPS